LHDNNLNCFTSKPYFLFEQMKKNISRVRSLARANENARTSSALSVANPKHF
jgi:hypothetical protein